MTKRIWLEGEPDNRDFEGMPNWYRQPDSQRKGALRGAEGLRASRVKITLPELPKPKEQQP